MKSPKSPKAKGRVLLRLLLGLTVVGLLPAFLWAQGPLWWYKEPNPPVKTSGANDYAAVNQGQLKNIATAAYKELEEKLPGGVGDMSEPNGLGYILTTLINTWSTVQEDGTRVVVSGHNTTLNTNDYAAVNLGQLKTVAKPFYDRLADFNYSGPPLKPGQRYPWDIATGATPATPNDYAMANIGQVKNLFSFDLASIPTSTAPTITSQPQNATAEIGQTATFTVTATGTPEPTYQWQKNGIEIMGATSPSYTTPTAVLGDNGAGFCCVASNSAGSATSNSATLTVPGDSDGNYLLDTWEVEYFTHTGVDPDADPDGDGITNRQEYEQGSNPLDFYNGQAPTLTKTNGDNQTNLPGRFVSRPLVVKVLSGSGDPLAHAPVKFTVTSGGGTLHTSVTGTNGAELTLRTNAYGYAITYFKLPNENAECQITCAPATGNYLTIVTFTETSDDGSASNPEATLPPDDSENRPTPPIVSYPAIDLSGGVTSGTVAAIALDDNNNGAFACGDPWQVYRWQDGNPAYNQTVPKFDTFTDPMAPPNPELTINGYYQPIILTPGGKVYGNFGWATSAMFICTGGQAIIMDPYGHKEWTASELNARYGYFTEAYFPYYSYVSDATENGYCRTCVILGPPNAPYRSEVSIGSAYFVDFYPDKMNNNGWAFETNVGGVSRLWNGSGYLPLPGVPSCINDQNCVIGGFSNDSWVWYNSTVASLTSLVPPEYQGQIADVNERLLSNADANGIIHILLDATFIDPSDGSTSLRTYVLSGPYASLSSTNCTLQEVQLPDGVNSSDIKCINANGVLAFIHNGGSGNSMTNNARMAGAQTMTAASSTSSVPGVGIAPAVHVMRVWSDQLPGVEANYLADAKYNGHDSVGTGLGNKKYIFEGAAQSWNFDGKGHIKAQVVVSGPDSLRNKILWRLAKGSPGNLTIASGSSSYATYDANSRVVSVTIDQPDDDDTGPDYILVGGYDADGDGQLSSSEATIIPKCMYTSKTGVQYLPFSVKIVSTECYNTKLQSITNWASNSASASPHASELLMAFAKQTLPSSATSSGATTVDRLEPGLDHPVGILFDASQSSKAGLPKAGPGSSIMANYDKTTRMSKDVANSVTMNNWLQDQLSLPVNDNTIREYFAQNPAAITGTLDLPLNGSMDFQPGSGSGGGDIDLFLAFGKVTNNLTAVVTVDRSLAVIEIKLTGDMTDIYDFNFDSDAAIPFVKDAANVQAGYNTLGIGGRVYKSTVHMQDTVLDDFQFHFP